MRDRETIDSELRLLAAVRRVCREHGGTVPSMGPVDELLDERGELTGSSKRDRTDHVILHGKRIHYEDLENLQALCGPCNQGKSNTRS